MKKNEAAAPAIGKKAKKVEKTEPVKVEAKVETKAKAEKPVKPPKKTFAKLPEAPVSEPVAKKDDKKDKMVVTPKVKRADSSGGKFTPPAISLSKIRKAAVTASSSDAAPAAEVAEVKANPVVQQTTMLPEAMVGKPIQPKKVEKPVAAVGKKTLDDLIASNRQATATQSTLGFNPLDYVKR